MPKDINGSELRAGDSVFNTKTGFFGKMLQCRDTAEAPYTIVSVEHDLDCRALNHIAVYPWSTNLTIKLDPDTPENRLFLKLKYA
jgi:hypothetical protein